MVFFFRIDQLTSAMESETPPLAPPPGIYPPGVMIPKFPGKMPFGMPPVVPPGIPPMGLPKGPPPFGFIKPEDLEVRFWRDYLDEQTGKVYYYNVKTKKKQWLMPYGYIKMSRKDQLRAIEAKQIGQTEWKVVTAFGGETYYYNSKTRKSAWKLPDEFHEKVKQEEMTPQDKQAKEEKKIDIKKEIEETEEEYEEEEYEEEEDYQPMVIEEPPKVVENRYGKLLDIRTTKEVKEETPLDDTPQTLDGIRALSHDKQIALFNKLLEEKAINRHSSWATAQPLIVDDIRFKAINSLVERRALVDSFIKKLKKSYKQEKKMAKKSKEDQFNTLVDEALTKDDRISFQKFHSEYKDKERYNVLGSDKDAEHLFYARKDELKKIEKKQIRVAEKEFEQLLEERVYDELKRNSRLTWNDLKYDLRGDKRYHIDLLATEDREDIFYKFKRNLRLEGHKRERSDKSKRMDEVYRLKEDMEWRAKQAKIKLIKKTESEHFEALLAEYVKNSSHNWEYWSNALSDDPRFDTEYLTAFEKEQLFDQRISSLFSNKEQMFHQLLTETEKINISSNWDDIRDHIANDPRYIALQEDEDKQILIFNNYVSELNSKMKHDLLDLLEDTKINPSINLESKKEKKELLELLRGDHRWTTYNDFPEKREIILQDYVMDIRNVNGTGGSNMDNNSDSDD